MTKASTFYQRKKRDYSSSEARQKLLKNEMLRASGTFFSRADNLSSNPTLKNLMDMDRIRSKRREKAAQALMDEVLAMYEQNCPELEESFYPAEDYAQWVSFPIGAYDLIESSYDIMAGAAFWILDELKRCGHLYKATKILPEIEPGDGEVVTAGDVCYSYDLIETMVYVLEHRNDDCKGYRSKDDQYRYWIDELTAQNKQHQEVPSRKRFEDILKLIPDERKEKACEQLKEKTKEAFALYLKCLSPLVKRRDRITIQIDRLIKRLDGYDKKQRGQLRAVRQIPGSPHIVTEEDILKLHASAVEDQDILDGQYDALDDINNKIFELRINLLDDPGHDSDSFQFDYGDEKENVQQFAVGDPFSLCFGLLYLLDQDDHLPWLYFPCCCVMYEAGRMLPWHARVYDEFEDPVHAWEEGDQTVSILPDLNLSKYEVNDPENDEYKYKMTLNQIIYECCGNRFPGSLDQFGAVEEELKKYNLPDMERLFVLTCCILMYSTDHQMDFSPWDEIQSGIYEDDQEKKQAESEKREAQNTIDSQKQELEALRSTAHRLQKNYSELVHKYQQLEKKNNADQQELGELRELIFNQENEVSQKVASGIVFPYAVLKNTVVFGGHPTWLKEIKPLLSGNIRFMEAPDHFDEKVVRNADIVWIQSNAISHSVYYRIMNCARAYDVPVHYLAFASARKCAEQIVKRDKG